MTVIRQIKLYADRIINTVITFNNFNILHTKHEIKIIDSKLEDIKESFSMSGGKSVRKKRKNKTLSNPMEHAHINEYLHITPEQAINELSKLDSQLQHLKHQLI